jgi:glycerophosphoryl diester phosphodiesterase
VELKAHKATWSGAHPPNSLEGLRECYAARVARTEIDFLSHEGNFVVTHDAPRPGESPPRLADALAIVREVPPGPTVLMLDAKDGAPWSSETVERLATIIEPVRERVFVGSGADWNLRRLHGVDPEIALTFDPLFYLETKDSDSPLPGAGGAYGYHDAHPLAFQRTVPVRDYLRERIAFLLGVVPGIRELHVRMSLFEQMRLDDFDVVAAVHDAGARIDLWTLDAGTAAWRERLIRALDAGTDIVTTNTPRALARAAHDSTVE